MHRLVGAIVACLLLQACSQARGVDAQVAMFAELFDGPYGTCRELRTQLEGEIEGLKAAKKKADDDFIAEQDAPAKQAKAPRSFGKQDPLAALRDFSKKSQQAEKLNEALKERRCRTVDIEAAMKVP